MTTNAMEQQPKLSSAVEISRQFLRSIRIDSDLHREDALNGYVCQGTARGLLESMSQQILQSQQRAFTWTGPYGGGKSSLALMLCALVGGSSKLRTTAKEILALPADSPVFDAFNSKGKGWTVFPLVGKRTSIKQELRRLLIQNDPDTANESNSDICASLARVAEKNKHGLLLIIDELGKFLEASALENGDDVNFFQDLAEAASRSKGKFVLVGILHQPFEAYAHRLGRQARDDWAKVQGRYIDIPLIAGADEIIELIAQSIRVKAPPELNKLHPIATAVADNTRKRRPATPETHAKSLLNCWPLHPVTTSLIGPISRRKFGQNERSIFGFLTSKEPLGFGEFIATHNLTWDAMYRPSNFWDYLRANMEPSILASPDGHRWAQAVDAVERAEAKGTPLHIEVVKTVGFIEMFRTGANLAADFSTVACCLPNLNEAECVNALQDLIGWKILIERKHLNAYGIYAGSDFDIEGSINQARSELNNPDAKSITGIGDLNPVIAKRLYHDKGAMHWFAKQLVNASALSDHLGTFRPASGSVGTFYLCLSDVNVTERGLESKVREISQNFSDLPVVLGVASNASRITDTSLELAAAEKVATTRTELEGDSVARRELVSRIVLLQQALQEELTDAFRSAKWYYAGLRVKQDEAKTLSAIASYIADKIYHQAPRINSELLNRDDLSTNTVKARRELMYRMIAHAHAPRLGYEGFPADAGIYYAVLHDTGFHKPRQHKKYAFGKPTNTDFEGIWQSASELLQNEDDTVTLQRVYDCWQAPPFGLKKGVLPVIALAYFLANKTHLALYLNGVFTPDISEVTIDELLRDPGRLKFKYVAAGENKASLAKAISGNQVISALTNGATAPLDIARGLVSFVFALPNWARRTNTVSKTAQEVRGMLLKASDPNKVLFTDLPALLNTKSEAELVERLKDVIDELSQSYPNKIREVNAVLLRALHHDQEEFYDLRRRASSVKGIAGEFEIEAFTNRVEEFDGSIEKTEALISLAVSKPTNLWVDRDLDAALLKLADNAFAFRKAEAMAPLRGRQTHRKYFNLVLSGGAGKDVIQPIEISASDQGKVDDIVKTLKTSLLGIDKKLIFASLAELGLEISEADT